MYATRDVLSSHNISSKELLYYKLLYTEEEKGGRAGMGEFVKTEAYRRLNVGFALDEGLSNRGEEFLVFNKEKSMWR